MPIFQFQTLWKNHPTIKGDAPVLDRKTYANQCAINVSASLIRSGISLKDFRGALSWDKGATKYALRAQELADWLTLKPRLPGKSRIKISAKNFNEIIARQSGIIFFQNYWGAGNQGDHIDLWNGSRLTDWSSWVRIQGHITIPRIWSDLEKAESIWFWGIS